MDGKGSQFWRGWLWPLVFGSGFGWIVLLFFREEVRVNASRFAPIVVLDPGTGCQYLRLTGDDGGLTPRLGTNGKPICTPPVPESPQPHIPGQGRSIPDTVTSSSGP